MAFTNIIVIRYDAFGNIVFQSPNTLNAGSIGQGLLRVQVPFDDATYTGSMTWSLANDQSIAQSFDAVAQVTIDETVWYQYDKPIDDTITVVSANNSTVDLKVTPAFTSTEQLLTMTQASIPVTAGDVSQLSPIAVDDAADIRAKKRDRDPSALTGKTTPGVSDTFTMWGDSEVAERSITFEDLKGAISEDVVSTLVYTTGVDTLIDDPVAGFDDFMKLVESTLDDDYPTAGDTITFTSTLTDTYEPITSSIYPLGFFNGTFSNLQFANNFTLKTDSGTGAIKIDYYKVDNPDDLTGTLLGSTEITFTNTAYTLQSKGGVLAGPFTIDPNDGEHIVGRVYGKTSTSGITLNAQIGGADPKTFTTWDIPSGAFSASKMNVILSPTLGNIVKQKADGNTEDAGVAVTNLALLSAIQSFLAKITFTDDVDIAQDLLVSGTATVENLIVSGTQTILNTTTVEVEDNIMLLAKGQASGLVDIGIEGDRGSDTNVFIGWEESSDLFKIGLVGSLERLATIADNPNTDEIFIYDGTKLVTRTAGQIKTLLSLGISDIAGLQTVLDSKISNIQMYVDGVAVGANSFTELNILSGGNIVQDGTIAHRANWDIFGAGTGEGTVVLGQSNTIVPITVLTSNTDITLSTQRQSTDLTVMELFDNAEVPANTFRVYKTETEIDNDPVQYKFFMQGTATNTNQAQAVTLSIRLFKDAIEVVTGDWPATAVVSEATAQVDGTNNFPIEAYVDTNILNAQEDYTLQISADATGVTLDALDIHFTSSFVSGEALSNIMRTDIYDTGKLGRVDKAKGDASGNDIELTYETIANVDLIRNPIIDEETATFELVLDDDGQVMKINSASAVIITVPLNSNVAFPIGTQIAVVRYGAGTVTFAPESTVNIRSAESNLAILNQYASVALLKIGTDEWSLVGSLE